MKFIGLPFTYGNHGTQGNLSYKKPQGNSGRIREFLFFFKLMETQGSFKILKISGNFFLNLELDLIYPVLIFTRKCIFIYF